MDAVILSRIQFALTVGFHFLFPPLTIGMAWIIFVMQTRYLKTKDALYAQMSRFWIKLFAISFVVGVASGVVMEFQFGTNWANYSRFVGDIFGAPLAAEGILAFFLESAFIGVLIWGKDKVSDKFYWFASLMGAVGSTLSAFWIIVANSWMQTPVAYTIVDGRAQLTDFWAAVFNPSTVPRYLHTITGALITGAFFMMGISAYYLLKKRYIPFAQKTLAIALVFGLLASLAQGAMGHYSAVQVANTQPAKLAAFEGLFETQEGAPLLLFGIPDGEEETVHFELGVPKLLSLLAVGQPDAKVQGLKDFPKDEWPPLTMTFYPFHLMVYLGGFFILVTIFGLILFCRQKLFEHELFLKVLLFSMPLPFITNELGWIAAEVGRQPWIVYGLMKTVEGATITVPAYKILLSLIIFTAVYGLLFSLWLVLIKKKVMEGPEIMPLEGGVKA
ncbi:MAG: cytochrome ubiquinol oxidase subunit I [Clostridia bacterium]|nr:cytochrome ubiquinol oxidase subunit I [Clostridia bacterium]